MEEMIDLRIVWIDLESTEPIKIQKQRFYLLSLARFLRTLDEILDFPAKIYV